jgi:quercetin dioxygenase-like cupin family protein
MITRILEFPAGAGNPNHMHGGNVLVTVLGGEMTLREKGTEKIVKAGESWTESPGNVHSIVNAGTTTARVVAVFLLPKGAEITTFVK